MSFPGGKSLNGVLQWIINQIPPHDVFIEPFLGDGAIMRRKRPAARSIGIDISPRVLERWTGDEAPSLELHSCDSIDWLKFHFGLFRFRKLDRSCLAIPTIDLHSRTFIYADPPYLDECRKSTRTPYRSPFPVDHHKRLLDLVRVVPANVMISGYDSLLYREALSGWRLSTMKVSTRSNSCATECVWMNYPEPIELHDYSFIGRDKRERERIRRRINSANRKIQHLSEIERKALRQSLDNGVVVNSREMARPHHD